MSYERHNPYAGTGPCCSNCHRVLLGAWIVCGGPERFCSSQCSAYFYGTAKASESPNCGILNCHVCSGAMRERKGDANG